MAMYVAKNGEEFEIVVKSKRDTRFDFLHSWHTHFPYYNFKKNLELTVRGSLSCQHFVLHLSCKLFNRYFLHRKEQSFGEEDVPLALNQALHQAHG